MKNYLSNTLFANNLGEYLDVQEVCENELFELFETVGRQICVENELFFAFSASECVQAGIIYDSRIVFMTYGMFNSICKLAEKMTLSGSWTGTEAKESDYYCLTEGRVPFKFSHDRNFSDDTVSLHFFIYVLNVLFRFIIFHEIAHYVKKHNYRDNQPKEGITSDMLGYESNGPEQDTLSKQARELVADAASFSHLLAYSQACFDSEEPLIQTLKGVFPNDFATSTLNLSIIYCYFKMMDNGKGADKLFTLSHPTAAFRAKVILSHYIEINTNEESDSDFIRILYFVINLSSTIFDSDRNSFLSEVQGEKIDDWFMKLYKEQEKWH